MVDTMNGEERVSRPPVFNEEDPTRVAELLIRLVPQQTGDQRLERRMGFGRRFNKDRIDIVSVRARLYAAIEAEAATVQEASAEIIDEELSRIMSPRSAVNDPAVRRPVRRAALTYPGAQQPTPAAELHITLVHG